MRSEEKTITKYYTTCPTCGKERSMGITKPTEDIECYACGERQRRKEAKVAADKTLLGATVVGVTPDYSVRELKELVLSTLEGKTVYLSPRCECDEYDPTIEYEVG